LYREGSKENSCPELFSWGDKGCAEKSYTAKKEAARHMNFARTASL
jgi:hypothetical protein